MTTAAQLVKHLTSFQAVLGRHQFGHSQSSLIQIVHNFTPACDVCVSHYTMVTLHRITWLHFVSPLHITTVYRELLCCGKVRYM